MDNNPANPMQIESPSRLRQLAWLPVPILALTIAALWVADLRTVYESRVAMVLLNLVFTWLASLFICLLTARGFLGSGEPGLLMFGCGSLLWGVTSLTAAAIVDRVNTTVTVHNLGVFGAALCHVIGLCWRGRLRWPGRWLGVGYAGALMMAAVIVWAALAGSLPVFFVQGQGGTLVREVVLCLAVAMFAWVAWRLIHRFRRQAGAFYYWYGLGLALVATGLTGVLLLSVQGGILGWTNRLTQYLGSAYLFVAAFMAARETGKWALSQAPAEEMWRENALVAGFQQQTPLGWALRYGLAAVAVAAAMVLRQAITAWVGPGLPPYITLYPVVMAVALLGGFGPGLVATALAGLATAYWVLSPVGQFTIASPVDRVTVVIFISMGVFMSAVAGFYRRYRQKAAAYDREAALRESQARLATFAAATFEGIVESEGGRIVDCNEEYSRMTGYSVAESRGVEIASLIAPEDRDRVMANIRQGEESSSEHTMLRKDGTRIIVEVHGRPVAPGSARRHTAIRDITERKRAETALQTTAQRFYDILSNMSSGVLLVTDEDQVEFANQAFCDLFGLADTPAALVGLSARGMIGKIEKGYRHPDEAIARIRDILHQGQPVKDEEVAMQGGRTCLRDFIPLSIGGKSYGRLWLHFDVTERKRAEEALRRSEERSQFALKTAHIGAWDLDLVDHTAFRSPEHDCIFGYPEMLHQWTYEMFLEHVLPEDRAGVDAKFQQANATQSDWGFECRIRRADGEVRWIWAAGRHRTGGSGGGLRMSGIVQDITGRKQTDEEIRRHAAELRATNAELMRFNQAMVGRELRMIELKKEVNALCAELRQPSRYQR